MPMATMETASKFGIKEADLELRLGMMRKLVAQPIPDPFHDPAPALIGDCLFVGNKYHAANVDQLVRLGVTAILNCASSGVSMLPLDRLKDCGISYTSTNVRRDDNDYPILHSHKDGVCSDHLNVAQALFANVQKASGKVLFFCVAGQNRSATLAIAVLLLDGRSLEDVCKEFAACRPFVMENVGFQRQVVELEDMLRRSRDELTDARTDDSECRPSKMQKSCSGSIHPNNAAHVSPIRGNGACGDTSDDGKTVEIELLVPGLCTFDVRIPTEATTFAVKQILVDHINRHFLAYSDAPAVVLKSWLVLAMFGFEDEFDLPLEEEAVGHSLQVARMRSMFGLTIVQDGDPPVVRWNEKCRFAVVILSVVKLAPGSQQEPTPEPWYFKHHERPGAPATLLENSLSVTHLRGWDFATGVSHLSTKPMVFSFSEDPLDTKGFMNVSTSKNVRQQFTAPGEGGILGIGSTNIVHRAELRTVEKDTPEERENGTEQHWDAAVKRSFSIHKMLASLENTSDAGVARRLRLANSLNEGRLVYYYGLGLALSSNSSKHNEFKFEVVLLARYQEEFASYTLKNFLADYTAVLGPCDARTDRSVEIEKLQAEFSLIKVKILLVSLLNAFRDLTLMGVRGFDFNNLSNVLVSRDGKMVRLIDIDANSHGSMESAKGPAEETADKPALDIELSQLLPLVVKQLLLGKGRGTAFLTDTISQVWRSRSDEEAKAVIKDVIRDNFFPQSSAAMAGSGAGTDKHLLKVTEWLHTLLKKRSPWTNWTNDIYDAMRCIDHLPIS